MSRLLALAALVTSLAACQSGADASASKAGAAPATPGKPAAAAPAKSAPAAALPPPRAELLEPAKLTEQAPEKYRVKFETNEGDFVVEVTRAWAPNGADRLFNLVKAGYFEDIAFFRAIDGFMVQFGIHGDPRVSARWRDARIQDDPVVQGNLKGRVTFAMGGPNSRTTQLFVNLEDNKRLDGMGFPSIGEVVDGWATIQKLHKGYGEGAPSGRGPSQGRIQMEGNAYLRQSFPELDYLKRATIL